MDKLVEWTSMASAELGIDAAEVDRAAVLEVARDVAQVAAKPAAMVTMYLFGVAVGRGMPGAEVADRLTKLAARWHTDGCDWSD